MSNIMDKLIDKIVEMKNPTVVGLDPRMDFIPAEIAKDVQDRYGRTAIAVKYALLAYNKGLIDAICDIVPAVKPQVAFMSNMAQRAWMLIFRPSNMPKAKA